MCGDTEERPLRFAKQMHFGNVAMKCGRTFSVRFEPLRSKIESVNVNSSSNSLECLANKILKLIRG